MAVDSGIGHEVDLPYSTALAIMSFVAIALYNVVELSFSIFVTFKKHRGLYFWSVLCATWGIAPYTLGFTFKNFDLVQIPMLYVTMIVIGWCFMVTGQNVVLYSRLHLIVRNEKRLKWILAMIIINAIICHGPIIVLVYGANSANPEPYILPYSIYEKIQVTIFFLQETFISAIYVYETARILRPEGDLRGRSARQVMSHLIWVNFLIIGLDITILAIEYAGLYTVQTTYKAAVYSIKLKMEFAILNRLIDMIQGRLPAGSSDGQRSQPTHIGSMKPRNKHKSIHLGSPADTTGTVGFASYTKPGKKQGDIGLDDIRVVKTAEVTVESEAAVAELEFGSKSDLEGEASFPDRKNSKRRHSPGRDSLSSSVVQFANKGS